MTGLWMSRNSLEFHHPNWRTQIFQRGRYTTNQWLSRWFLVASRWLLCMVSSIAMTDHTRNHKSPGNELWLSRLEWTYTYHRIWFRSMPSKVRQDLYRRILWCNVMHIYLFHTGWSSRHDLDMFFVFFFIICLFHAEVIWKSFGNDLYRHDL